MGWQDFKDNHIEAPPDLTFPPPEDDAAAEARRLVDLPDDFNRAEQPPQARRVLATLDRSFRVYARELPAACAKDLKQRLTFKNPRYQYQTAAGQKADASPYIYCWHETDGVFSAPRGSAREVVRVMQKHGLRPDIDDKTCRRRVEWDFTGDLYGYQDRALNDITARRFGILEGPLGSGKKVVAAAWLAVRQASCLVIVRRIRQLHQWVDMAGRFMGLEPDDVGVVGGGQWRVKDLTVCTDKMAYKLLDVTAGDHWAAVVADQVETANMKIFFRIVARINSGYVLGLANGRRNDKRDGVMRAHMGPVLHRMDVEPFGGMASRPKVVTRRTGWRCGWHGDWAGMLKDMAAADARTGDIVGAVITETADKKIRAIVLAHLVEHLDAIADGLSAQFRDAEKIYFRTPEKQIADIADRFNRGRLQVILCPFKGLDKLEGVEAADRVFLAAPVKAGDLLIQTLGKLLAGRDGAKLYDFVDDELPVLKAQAMARRKYYQMYGFVV